jgi:hypothetical protein
MNLLFKRAYRPASMASLAVATLFSISSVAAAANCGLCDTEVVINSELASCFLEKYEALAREGDQAIVVDLSDCPASRGIVEPLPSPGMVSDGPPDTEFMISRTQLDCLKKKLEDPQLQLDPSAKIDLASCS